MTNLRKALDDLADIVRNAESAFIAADPEINKLEEAFSAARDELVNRYEPPWTDLADACPVDPGYYWGKTDSGKTFVFAVEKRGLNRVIRRMIVAWRPIPSP